MLSGIAIGVGEPADDGIRFDPTIGEFCVGIDPTTGAAESVASTGSQAAVDSGGGSVANSSWAADIVTYAGGIGDERFRDVIQLSDQTFLVAGSAETLDWIPAGTPVRTISGHEGIRSAGSGRIGYLMHLSADMQTIQDVLHLPADTVVNLQKLRTSEIPGERTGDLFVSGLRRWISNDREAGYFIGKLDGNYVDALPTRFEWTFDVHTRPPSEHDELQPWDVRPDGKVVYGYGDSHNYNWAAIGVLDADGVPTTMEHWPLHSGDAGEHYDSASSYPGLIDRSLIVVKAGRSGSLRSRTADEHAFLGVDENGSPGRQGTYPDDVFFSGHDSSNGPGYTGYRVQKPTGRIGEIVVDRRSGDFYYGYSIQSRLPDGNPDFEPAIVAMDDSGATKWWGRMYRDFIDDNGNGVFDDGEFARSTPDQYVDSLAIDYSSDSLVVLARAHGNNVINFFKGHEIAANPTGSGFQNQFTGSSGNIHLQWIGKYGLNSGQIHAATYMGEYPEGNIGQGTPIADGLLAGWPDPNAGWPNLNTTRSDANSLSVDADGNVYVAAYGRRPFTTSNAFQQMTLPGEGFSSWSSFIRVYTPDLSDLAYSSLLAGDWDPDTEQLAKNTKLYGFVPTATGVVVVGQHLDNGDDGVSDHHPIPTANVPPWGRQTPGGEEAIFASLNFRDALVNIEEVQINDGEAQRSLLTEVEIHFDGPVQFDASAVTIEKLGSVELPAAEVSLAIENGRTVATIRFSGAHTIDRGGAATSLEDGDYRMTLFADRFVAGSRTPAANWTLDSADGFFRRFGDVDGSGTTDLLDFGDFRTAFGNEVGDTGFMAALDSNGDGQIGLIDFGEFRESFNR